MFVVVMVVLEEGGGLNNSYRPTICHNNSVTINYESQANI